MNGKKINRRRAIKAIAGGVAASSLLPLMNARPSGPLPNIVFVLIDDQRFDAMGFMGNPWLKTPNMDRLAREGVQFTNSFVNTSLCSPSRASFLTGMNARCHGVMNNATPWVESNVTFLELLRARGYDTGFIGKWHMPGGDIPDLVGQGKVDRMVSFAMYWGQGRYFDCPLIIDGEKTKSKGYITDILTQHALEFLDKPRKKPFCLYLSHKAVHAMFKPPERHKGKLDGAIPFKLEKPTRELPQGLINKQQRNRFDEVCQGYYEALMAVDESLGKVLDHLDTKGLAENTLVVYTSDNGYFWGEHGLIDKRYAYEEGIRIPHLMRYPRLIPEGGKTVSEMVLNVDLAPTLLAATGSVPTKVMQGKSYLDMAAGKKTPWRQSFLYEYFKDPASPHPAIEAVRTKDWKYITFKKSDLPEELYNLADDPGERNDLAFDAAYAPKKKELKAEMERLKREQAC